MLRKLTSQLRVVRRVTAVYCAVGLIVLVWPTGILLLVLALVFRMTRRTRQRITTLGSARWADKEDLARNGMLGAKSGLILGRMLRPVSKYERLIRSNRQDEIVRLPQAIHTAIFAPTGAGKGVSLANPFLLSCDDSAVVTDFKGELAKISAAHRHDVMGHQIALVDPYGLVTQKPDTYNSLDPIGKDHPRAIDDCNDLANAIVERTGHEHEPYWNDMAETLIAAVTATVVGYGEQGTRSLQTVREIISHSGRLNLAIKLMMESDKWGGALAPMGGQIASLAEKERSSVVSSALRHLRFLGSPAVMESTRTSSFDPALLRTGRMTVYLILPPDRAHAQSGLLRMWVGSMLRACVRGGLQ